MIAAQDPARSAWSADPPKIEDYAVIGDCRSAALISRSGSIDWLCLPDFSSQSFFAAILDREVGGRFAIRPLGTFETDAYQQVQLDVYGGVISAAVDYALAGGSLQKDQLRLLAGFGKVICGKWREPDHGIWEQRGRRKHYTFSKLMCWLGLDSLLRLSALQPLAIEERAFRSERDAIRAVIERRGFREPPGSYVGALGEDWLDASLLLMSCLGYCSADDPRMRRSCDTIREKLGRNGLIYRYLPGSDGLQSTEGAFGICSFWMVDNLASRGEVDAARQLFERLLGCANDLLLFSEEVDPETGELLGNFPQAFTHVGLINAAFAIHKAQQERRA